jgi:hypothetical protein
VTSKKHFRSVFLRPIWLLIAVCCILFSGASKKLIELKLAHNFTTSQLQGMKLKNGCRDKRDSFRLYDQSEKKAANASDPEFLFSLPALSVLAFIFLFGAYFRREGFLIPAQDVPGNFPIYLFIRKLQV